MKLIIKYDLEDTFFMGTEEQIEKWLKSDAFKEVSREINQKSEEINKNFEENNEKQTATATNA